MTCWLPVELLSVVQTDVLQERSKACSSSSQPMAVQPWDRNIWVGMHPAALDKGMMATSAL